MLQCSVRKYCIGSRLQGEQDAGKEIFRCCWLFVLTELVVRGTQCIDSGKKKKAMEYGFISRYVYYVHYVHLNQMVNVL